MSRFLALDQALTALSEFGISVIGMSEREGGGMGREKLRMMPLRRLLRYEDALG